MHFNVFCFFFFHINPIALRKAKIVHNFGLSKCNRVKRKALVPSKDIKIIFFAIFFYIFLTVKSSYMLSEKKKVFKKKKVFLPTYPKIFQTVT